MTEGTDTGIAQANEADRPRPPRRIILFSDGTGNSSGKLFKTNVWRLYEAVDLGPAAAGDEEQIGHYSNGVGTSAFRPLALMGGIFGFGLKSNILDLYKYLCRNWIPGDRILLFGFSRGAFTIRLLVGLIASQGILRGATRWDPPDEDTLSYQARAAYRSFAGDAWPNRVLARSAARVLRAARNAVLAAHRRITDRKPYDRMRNSYADIDFVGVWDTVAAYGGPIVEITRGIDDWIWPLTMPNYQLSPRVLKARHALSLDDERDAFQPLLWDEVRELMLIRHGGAIRTDDPARPEVLRRVPEGRLKQVWFSGMHADVGGGYSDESLSFVSLLWMIDELDDAVRLLPEHTRRIASMSNAYGPIHNSRAGLGGYYRFQPRRIRALVDWFAPKQTAKLDAAEMGNSKPEAGDPEAPRPLPGFVATRSLRDPEIADRSYKLPIAPVEDETHKANQSLGDQNRPAPTADRDDAEIAALAQHIRRDHGLLTSVRVHESAVLRIASGTDNYAPISLPPRFDIVFADDGGLSRRQLHADLAKRIRDRQRDPAYARYWNGSDAVIGDMIWCRRIQYFLLAGLSVLLATMPLWTAFYQRNVDLDVCADGRCVFKPAIRAVGAATGGYAGPWIDAFSANVLPTLVLLAGIATLFVTARAYDLRLRSCARAAWRTMLLDDPDENGPGDPPDRKGVARMRATPAYQWTMTALKWFVAPALAAAALLSGAAILVAAAVSQFALYPAIERQARCQTAGGPPVALERGSAVQFELDTRAPCVRTGARVLARHDYGVRLTVVPDQAGPHGASPGWSDGGYAATPGLGRGADLPWWIDAVGSPFRRMSLVGWLQPMTLVRGDGGRSGALPERVDIDALELTCDTASGSYIGRFRPRIDGALGMSVNDAIVPWSPFALYGNNRGRAVMQIWTGPTAPDPPVLGSTLPCTQEAQ